MRSMLLLLFSILGIRLVPSTASIWPIPVPHQCETHVNDTYCDSWFALEEVACAAQVTLGVVCTQINNLQACPPLYVGGSYPCEELGPSRTRYRMAEYNPAIYRPQVCILGRRQRVQMLRSAGENPTNLVKDACGWFSYLRVRVKDTPIEGGTCQMGQELYISFLEFNRLPGYGCSYDYGNNQFQLNKPCPTCRQPVGPQQWICDWTSGTLCCGPMPSRMDWLWSGRPQCECPAGFANPRAGCWTECPFGVAKCTDAGTCPPGDLKTCPCRAGFFGSSCQTTCAPPSQTRTHDLQPCSGHGDCVQRLYGGNPTGLTCVCQGMYGGSWCETDWSTCQTPEQGLCMSRGECRLV